MKSIATTRRLQDGLSIQTNSADGGLRAKDGLFTAKTELDFELLAKRNLEIAESKRSEKAPVFEPGQRERVGWTESFPEGDDLVFVQHLGTDEKETVQESLLPLSDDIEIISPKDPDRTWPCPAGGASPVCNPTGAWTFWTLMQDMANGTASTSDFIKHMFDHWRHDPTVNGHPVASRRQVWDDLIEQ
jgi:hypothetical protein